MMDHLDPEHQALIRTAAKEKLDGHGHTLVILHGDRTGEEIMQATLKVLDGLDAPNLEHN